MEIKNNTDLTIEQIEAIDVHCEVDSQWRRRNIKIRLYGENVISDGVTYDQSLRVIAIEPQSQWAKEILDAAFNGIYHSVRK